MSDCIQGSGHSDRDGYIRLGRGKTRRLAHREAYSRAFGPIPEGHVVCHRCDNPPCVNPEHLFAATQLENMADRNRKGRQARGTVNGRAKLVPEQVIAIRADERPLMEIAAEYGVDRSTIRDIKTRKNWKHL